MDRRKTNNIFAIWERRRQGAFDLCTSIGGMSAAIAEKPRSQIEDIRDWCNFLLTEKNPGAGERRSDEI